MKRAGVQGLVAVAVAVAGIAAALVLASGNLEDVVTDTGPPPSAKLTAAAAAGEPDACFDLGERYRLGHEVTRDAAAAARWFECAARGGHAGARYALGRLFETGDGVDQDFRKAASLYRLTADIGNHPGAQFALGQLYYSGRGVANDYGQAIAWYRRAAEGDHAPAHYLLGRLYEHGWGVTRDPIAAYAWYMLAMRRADRVRAVDAWFDPQRSRARLAASMNRFQVDTAEKRARAWRPGR